MKKKRNFIYNVILKALNKIINTKNNSIFSNKDLFDYLNKLALKKTIKEFRAKKNNLKGFLKKIKIVIN